MKPAHEKYIPFVPLKMTRRAWPDRELKAPPVWCSVDLRDGNQALIDPMNVREKLELFHTLVDIGVKEIEVGFPSASETEYEFIRTLIEGGHIPDDVTIQVLVQAREHLIRRTFEAIDGAKHVIFHFYNSTSTLQRKVVFHMDMDGITKIATDAAKLIYELSQPVIAEGMDLRYEYSPESFMGTEMDAAVEICQAVIEAIGATPERKVILNLPTTVENCMPNYFADEIEYFISRLPGRDRAIISLHPHNDRGEGVATAELGLLAGANNWRRCIDAVAVLGFAAMSLAAGIDLVRTAGDTAQDCQNYLIAFVPVYSGIAAAGGQTAGALVYSGMFFAMAQFLAAVIGKLLLPVLEIYFCFAACACVWGSRAVEEAAALFSKCLHWLLKVCGAVFSFVLGLQSVLAGTADSAALRTGKSVLQGAVPVVGDAAIKQYWPFMVT